MSLWNFVQDQLLGMAWLNDLIGRGLSKVGVDTTSPIAVSYTHLDVYKRQLHLCCGENYPVCRYIGDHRLVL